MRKMIMALATGLLAGSVGQVDEASGLDCSDFELVFPSQAMPCRNGVGFDVTSSHKVKNNGTSSGFVCLGIQEGVGQTYNINESSIDYLGDQCQQVPAGESMGQSVAITGNKLSKPTAAWWDVEVYFGWWCGESSEDRVEFEECP